MITNNKSGDVFSAVIIALTMYAQISHGLIEMQSDKEKHVRAIDIQAVEGKRVALPCPLIPPESDKVYMVLWFRDDAGIPLYSVDVRGKPLTEARHWSSPATFGDRAKFNADTEPATLELADIKRHDQGVYRCRVDFRTSQTQSFRYNLTIIIPPEHPMVLNRYGRPLNGSILGPMEEGDDIMLTCRVIGGRPQPEVRWLVNGLLVDDQYEHNSGDVIENRLLWPSVQRTDLNSVFTCQAVNTLLVEPKESSFVMDLHLKPLTVQILNPPTPLVADRRYEVACESAGCRPNAIITWYKGKRQLRRTKDETFNNTTRSELSFVPSTEDDGKSITCRAENPNVTGLFLETTWKLDVVYPPIVSLRLGSTLASDDIKEGDDVYFECHVQANPLWRKLYWLHDGVILTHNTSARIIRSNQSLVLQKVTRQSSGNYSCSAINAEGETVSNQLELRVKYAPLCVTDKVVLVGAYRGEQLNIYCQVHADPPPRLFRWKFNNSGETLDVGKDKSHRNGSTSVLQYQPQNDQDFGTLSCWGQNEVGLQKKPCSFQIVLAALPASVRNCSFNNQTMHSFEVQCTAGFDGGLPQVFVLEVISLSTRAVRLNMTNSEEPYFLVESLDSLLHPRHLAGDPGLTASGTMIVDMNGGGGLHDDDRKSAAAAISRSSATSPATGGGPMGNGVFVVGGGGEPVDREFKAIVYAINQKGSGPRLVLKEFVIGETGRADRSAPDTSSLQISPILIGSVVTLLVLFGLMVFRMMVRRNSKSNESLDNSKQSSSLLCAATDVNKKSLKTSPHWQYNDPKRCNKLDSLKPDAAGGDAIGLALSGGAAGNNVLGGGGGAGGSGGIGGGGGSENIEDDGREPDVIPAQYVSEVGLTYTAQWTNEAYYDAARPKNLLLKSPIASSVTTATTSLEDGGHHHHQQQQNQHQQHQQQQHHHQPQQHLLHHQHHQHQPHHHQHHPPPQSHLQQPQQQPPSLLQHHQLHMSPMMVATTNTANTTASGAANGSGLQPMTSDLGAAGCSPASSSSATAVCQPQDLILGGYYDAGGGKDSSGSGGGGGGGGNDLDINVHAIKNMLMATRVPESCV